MIHGGFRESSGSGGGPAFHPESTAVGIFFSANDSVLGWTEAFLRSLRAANPDLPVRWIPFGSEVSRTTRLVDHLGYETFDDPSFSRLEGIGQKLDLGLTPYGRFWFRRFAVFWGPFQRFLYLDCRTLVLANLAPWLATVENFDLVHYDVALDQVYERGPTRVRFLEDRRAAGFLSGMWASRRGLFSLEELERYGQECQQVRGELNPRNTDQFFLNYCCDAKGVRTGHVAEILGDTCHSGWARQPGYVYRDIDGYRRWDHGGLDHRKRVPLLHWAGIKFSPAMPEAELFFQFRDQEMSLPRRLWRRVCRTVQRPFLRFAWALRRNRRINGWWKAIRGR